MTAKKIKLKVIPFKSWSPTRLADYEECPLKAQLKHALKLCPSCFKGTMPWEGPCPECGVVAKKGPALERGIKLDDELTAHLDKKVPLAGEAGRLVKAHPELKKIVGGMARSKGKLQFQPMLMLSREWGQGGQYDAWLRVKLDVLSITGKTARVDDWKSGNIDKRTNNIRYKPQYEDQLEIYQVAVLALHPGVLKVDARLIFLDAPQHVNPVVSRPVMQRSDLEKQRKKWEGRVKPMFADEIFAPRPSDYACRFCDFSKAKGGPCAY